MNTIILRKQDLNGVFAHYTYSPGKEDSNQRRYMTFPQFCGFVTDLCKPFLGTKRSLSVFGDKKKDKHSRHSKEEKSSSSLFREEKMGSTMRKKVAKNLIRSGFVGVVFASVQRSNKSMSMKKDTKRDSVIGRHMKSSVKKLMKEGKTINFVEFLEAVGMLAELLYPNPYNVLSVNLKEFLDKHLFRNCTIDSNAPDYSLKDAFLEAETAHTEYIATLRHHNMVNLYSSIRDSKIRNMGLVAHAEFSGNGVHTMLMNDDKETQVRAERTIGSRVDMKHGIPHSLLV